jgi:hypothetical protein
MIVLKFMKGGSDVPVTMTPRLPPGLVFGYKMPVAVLTSAEELI